MGHALGLCAGCRNKISNKEYLNCTLCNLKYDLQCASISKKRFSAMNNDIKNKWKCQGCRVKQFKNACNNNPLCHADQYIIDSSDMSSDLIDFSLNMNITQRKKISTACPASNDDINLPTTSLTKQDVREIIREEFNIMRSELAQEFHQTLKQLVRTEFQSLKNEISILEESVKFLDQNYETTKTTITVYQETLGKLQKENVHLNNTVQDLQTRLQIMEQHNRSNNLEIQCVPEHRQENLMSTILQLSKVVSCDLKETDIHHCTRVAKSNKDDKRPRSIIVKLATPRLRDTFLAKTINFNKANPNDKINTSHLGFGGSKMPIYILEQLITNKQKITRISPADR